jgi:hypothetical protein
MVPVHVAVVPHYSVSVGDEELAKVTAALQVQVTRDFAPIWGITATVSAFRQLQHVPPGFMPLVIVASVPDGHHGVHYSAGSHPVALVRMGDGWSQMASHEVLELIVDPWGNRTMPGRSNSPNEGQVEYLLEICDPCQTQWYLIDGVMVSDFVTPEFYVTSYATGLRYSFLGRVQAPRTPLEHGYITWRLTGREEVYQQYGGQDPVPLPTGLLAALALRPWVDWNPSAPVRPGLPRDELDQAAEGYQVAADASTRYGDALQRDIDYLLARPDPSPHARRGARQTAAGPPAPPDASAPPELRLLYELGYTPEVYDAFQQTPHAVLERYFDAQTVDTFPAGPLAQLAEPCVFQWAYGEIIHGGVIGGGIGFFGAAAWWLAALGGG